MPEETRTSKIEHLFQAAINWYESQRNKNGLVNTNVITTGLIVSSMIRDGIPIVDERFYSKAQSQVKGLSGNAVSKLLKQHGETRPFTSEGGRTSRGTIRLAEGYRNRINTLAVDLAPNDIEILADGLEKYFAKCAGLDYFDKQRLDVEIDPAKPVSNIIADILHAAAERADRPTGTVLQHLIGAKLQLRFPNEDVGLDKANAADQQTNREGDFQIGTTAFHVTVAPMEKLIDRSIRNKKAGYRPIIITPERRVVAALQMVENFDPAMADKIGIQSAESFIGTNIEEIATYDSSRIRYDVARLIRTYNQRISMIESDGSLQIEEPSWLVMELDECSN